MRQALEHLDKDILEDGVMEHNLDLHLAAEAVVLLKLVLVIVVLLLVSLEMAAMVNYLLIGL
jgi:hypothetical protein